MPIGKQKLCVLMFSTFFAAPASAATMTEVYTFDATLTAGGVFCGPFVGAETFCPEMFGIYATSAADELMHGKSMNGTYAGRIALEFEDGGVVKSTCVLGGAKCNFSMDLLNGPFGDTAEIDFSKSSEVLSVFRMNGDTGSYFFASDYTSNDDGVHYYSRVEFDLSNVEREMPVVPLMGSAGFLLAGIGGFAAINRRKKRAR